jgi:hypothetical protein
MPLALPTSSYNYVCRSNRIETDRKLTRVAGLAQSSSLSYNHKNFEIRSAVETAAMTDVFVSYSQADRAAVERLAESLEAQGLSVWWDTALLPGDTFRNEIRKRLNEARAVVVVWSVNSVHSDWVYAEAMAADEQGKLITVSLQPDLLPLVPLPFTGRHTDLIGETEKIKYAIHRKIDTPEPSSREAPAPKGRYASVETILLAAAVVALLATAVGFVLGRRDSPDYSNITQNYGFIAINYRVKSISDEAISLAVVAGPYEFSYSSRDNVVRRRANPTLSHGQRYRSQELATLSTLLAYGAAPGATIAGANKIAGSFISKLPKAASRPEIAFIALLTGTAGVIGSLGYWYGYEDTRQYHSKEFLAAVHDTEYWASIAAQIRECRVAVGAVQRPLRPSGPKDYCYSLLSERQT